MIEGLDFSLAGRLPCIHQLLPLLQHVTKAKGSVFIAMSSVPDLQMTYHRLPFEASMLFDILSNVDIICKDVQWKF